MDKVIEKLRAQAKKGPKIIVFPESQDSRIIEAVKFLDKEKIAIPLLLTPDNIEPAKKEEFTKIYYERRKKRGITLEEARVAVDNPLYYSALLVKCGYADGFVAGAVTTTSKVMRASLHCLDLDDSGVLSSCFIMIVPETSYGEEGVFVFADCAVNPSPTSEKLALIALSAGQFAKSVLGFSPRIAMLSFSSKGSGKDEVTMKVKEAVEIANSKEHGFLIDGELQAESAIVETVAKKKVGESPVAGKANVLIFPNLDSGNIAYKLLQRLGKAIAIGPIILGTKQSASDLSRGCSVDDIIDSTAVTVIKAQK